jgi:signal transduction histidine kinase
MKTMSELLNEAIENVRQIASELRPGILDDLGLAAAVEWLAERVQERHGIVCTTVVDPEDLLLDPDRSTTIFRILQESLANIVRHSGASKAEISLHQTEDRIILKVKDNGIGLDPETGKPKKGGLGLVGMRERARLFDGIFEVTSKPGLGTTITVQIPSPLPVPGTEA